MVGWFVMVAPIAASASPFCVQTQAIPPQCIYVDAGSCNKRAIELGGSCTVNPAEVHVSAGLGHYCLLTSSLASACIYPNRVDCERDAKRQQGVCVDNPGQSETPAVDPFSTVRPLMVGH
jgi:hypothetical protein